MPRGKGSRHYGCVQKARFSGEKGSPKSDYDLYTVEVKEEEKLSLECNRDTIYSLIRNVQEWYSSDDSIERKQALLDLEKTLLNLKDIIGF